MLTRTNAGFALLSSIIASTAVAQVPGDECSNALTAVVGTNTANTATMTPSPEPPFPDKSCPALGWTPTTKDAWFRFEAPAAGELTLDLCGSDYNTSIVVYQGPCGSLERIACDDDGCGGTNRSRIDLLPVEAGAVFIRVGGSFSAAGVATMQLAFEVTVGQGVYAFGADYFGQLRAPSDLGDCIAIAGGFDHAIALKADRSVVCWGRTIEGQCNVPQELANVTAIAGGGLHTIALKSDGSVVCWGNNNAGQCTVPPGLASVTGIAAGWAHTIARKADGSVVCWGWNGYDQCAVPPGLTNISAIASGGEHTIALKTDGSVVCWGSNSFGQCTVPPRLANITAIAGGSEHTIALRADGSVLCWGRNSYGRCNVPPGLANVTAIAGGGEHTVALRADGSVVGWGNNYGGQCVSPRSFGSASKIASGWAHTIVLSLRDCDGNLVTDQTELAGHDCDGNGAHDCWDVEVGALEDCNANSLGDLCEKQVTLDLASSDLSPIGFQHPQEYAIPNAVPAIAPVRMTVRAKGDLDAFAEYLRVSWPGFERELFRWGLSCLEVGDETFIPPDTFNAGIGPDGTWRAAIIASSAVDPFLCPGGTRVRIELEYAGAATSDCDVNGVLDSCQIADGTAPDTNGNGIIDTCENPIAACPTDFNADRITGPSDLAVLLGAWNSAGSNGTDLNGDGTVNSADLAVLLGAWGPCPES